MPINLLEDEVANEKQPINLLADEESYYPDQKPLGFVGTVKRAAKTFGNDISKIPGAVGNALVKGLNAAPSEIAGYEKQLFTDPNRVATNVKLGGQEAVRGMTNIPSDMAKYMAHLGLVSPEHAQAIPNFSKWQDTIENEKSLGAQQPGDVITRGIPQVASMIPVLPEGIVNAAGKTASFIPKEIASSVKAIPEALRTGEAKQAFEQASAEHAALPNTEKEIPKIENSINKNEEKLQNLSKDIQNIAKEKPIGESISPEKTEQYINHVNNLHDQAKNLVNESKEDINKYLNQGEEHDVNLAHRFNNIFNEQKKEVGKVYDEVEKYLADKNIVLSNPKDATQLNNELMALIKNNEARSPKGSQLINQLENLGKGETVPARDYLAAFRTARDAARDTRKSAYEIGINDEERQLRFKKADDLEKKVEEMAPILEKGIGKEASEKLKSANKIWSEKIAPVHKNKIYNQIRYQGRVNSENIAKSLRGTGEGMEQVRDIIKNDPELIKNVVGQRWDAKEKAVLNPNTNLKQYTDKLPEYKKLIENHQEANRRFERAKELQKEAKEHHNRAIKSANETEKTKSANETLKGTRQEKKKELDKLVSQIKKSQENLKEKRLQAKEKKISLGEKVKREAEFKKAQEAHNRLVKRIKIIGAVSGLSLAKMGIKALLL